MTSLRAALVALAFAAGFATVFTIASCASTLPAPPPPDLPYVSFPCEIDVLGCTVCTTRGPRSYIAIDVVESSDSLFVKAHERKHEEQMRRFGNCRDFTVWFINNTADAEAEAFCAGAKTEENVVASMERAAHWLAVSYPYLRLTYQDALFLITKYCA